MRDLTLPGKGKAWFSLSSRIQDTTPESWIRAAPTRTALTAFAKAIGFARVAKSPMRDLTLPGKGKTGFSLSSRIQDTTPESWIRAAPNRTALTAFAKAIGFARVAKSPMQDLTLPGKGKTGFSLSSRIQDTTPESWIRAPRAGRGDAALQVP